MLAAAAVAAVLAAACTNDYGAFDFSAPLDAGSEANSGGGAGGSAGAAGSAGSPGGAAGVAGVAGLAGAAGTGGPGGSGGSGGVSGSAGQAGVGGSPCPAGEKQCPVGCRPLDDPNAGCADPTCAPCAFPHAKIGCSAGACAITSCAKNWADCSKPSSGPDDGCETHSNDGSCP